MSENQNITTGFCCSCRRNPATTSGPSLGSFNYDGQPNGSKDALCEMCANWRALERAVFMTHEPLDTCADFMYMGESPAGTFQYKHRGTRNYANLRADSTVAECVAELAKACSNERTWGKAFDFETAGARHA